MDNQTAKKQLEIIIEKHSKLITETNISSYFYENQKLPSKIE